MALISRPSKSQKKSLFPYRYCPFLSRVVEEETHGLACDDETVGVEHEVNRHMGQDT